MLNGFGVPLRMAHVVHLHTRKELIKLFPDVPLEDRLTRSKTARPRALDKIETQVNAWIDQAQFAA
jgi:hypothetical protein